MTLPLLDTTTTTTAHVSFVGFYIAQSVGTLRALYSSHSGRPAHSGTNSTSLGRHTSITREDYSHTFPPLSIARYSFIQLSQLGYGGDNENAQSSKWQQRVFEPELSRFRARNSTAPLHTGYKASPADYLCSPLTPPTNTIAYILVVFDME